MKAIYKTCLTRFFTFILFFASSACGDNSPYRIIEPSRFESDIAQFEQADKGNFPKLNSILFLGSSSIRYWASSLAQDMSPLSTIARGFGGSNMNDVIHYMDRIVLPYKPRAIVLYVGENDVVHGVSPEAILGAYQLLVTTLHEYLPNARIYFVSIKPTPARRGGWETMQITNKLINTEAASDPLQHYIDIATPMLDDQGHPKVDIFLQDGIHMNESGYTIWTRVIKPVLIEHEGKFEN